MDLNNLAEAFGGKIAGSMIPQQTTNWGCDGLCQINYAFICEPYSCDSGQFECNIFSCDPFQCEMNFSCANMGGGNDFTCYSYTQAPGCTAPVPSVPC